MTVLYWFAIANRSFNACVVFAVEIPPYALLSPLDACNHFWFDMCFVYVVFSEIVFSIRQALFFFIKFTFKAFLHYLAVDAVSSQTCVWLSGCVTVRGEI